jgi:signal peptidase II
MIIAGVIFLDQLSKWLTVINLDFGETFPLIENVFHFTYVRNTGAAFSIFNQPDQRWIFMSISTVALVALSIYLWFNRKNGTLLCVALSFIIGGGIGNMIDRCLLKYVIDMLDFRLINFAVFNVADSFVCVGVGLFAFAVLREEFQAMKKEKTAKLAVQGGEVLAESDENEENGTDLNN